MADALLILDADGVFMDERPYWDAALGTALVRGGLAADVDGRWETLADAAFGDLALQRVAKARGCNSNWDLAAVLETALGRAELRAEVRALLRRDAPRTALERWRDAATTLGPSTGTTLAIDSDPLSGFGIDRNGAAFRATCVEYQRVLFGKAGIDWRIERTRLLEPGDDVIAALEACRGLGFELRVCTGRSHEEIDAPIRELGLDAFLPPDRVTGADEVDLAEQATGRTGLGKPHPFPVLCATLGYARACDVLTGGGAPAVPRRSVYVGDGWSDFLAVGAARDAGVGIGYVHVRSPIVPTDQLAAITAAPFTLGAVDGLGGLAPLLSEVPA